MTDNGPKFPHHNDPLSKLAPGKSVERIKEELIAARTVHAPGRPPHEVTEATRGLVTVLAGMGQTKSAIYRAMRIDEKTFDKYYSFEYENGKTTLDGQALMALFLNIQKGKERSIIYYLGCRVEGFMPFNPSLFNTQPIKTAEATPDNIAAADALFESARK